MERRRRAFIVVRTARWKKNGATTTKSSSPSSSSSAARWASLLGAIVCLCWILPGVTGMDDLFQIDTDVIRNMAWSFGRELSTAGTEQTCLSKIEENFQQHSQDVTWFDGNKMMDDMRHDIMNMLNWKRHAVERIANESERLAANHSHDKNIENFQYQRVTDLDPTLFDGHSSSSSNFDNRPVNFDTSSIHVPVDVYEKAIINDIKWSDALTPFFTNNRAFDPSLSWQFFGSARGFLRLFPTTPWLEPFNFSSRPMPDLYDARTRPWYILGAASPKDIVILLDTSGSMTGVRKLMAAHVVEQILDTLTDNDYVAALQFSNNVKPIHGCLDTLVQANQRNIAEIKSQLPEIKTSEFVNFTAALVEAFDLLQKFNRSGLGSQCNQAIMLVTDGAPNTYEDVFRQYNWPNIPVRVFTYLVGHDVTSHNEVYWMACHNRGYYTHISSPGEVREQVQKYIPVMSRPIVLSGQRTFAWTPAYALAHEHVLSNTLWHEKQAYELRMRLRKTHAAAQVQDAENEEADESTALEETSAEEENLKKKRKRRSQENSQDEKEEEKEEKIEKKFDKRQVDGDAAYYYSPHWRPVWTRSTPTEAFLDRPATTLYTTLATPVFDSRNYTNITKRILIKNVYQDTEPELVRIANLLGVAGIDIPIREIVKLAPAFKLGVNAYVFITNNNGHVIHHPDLRPFFDDFLKPYYNSVDLTEVELSNSTTGPREMDSDVGSIRRNMIDRTHGWKKMAVRMHQDGMRRALTRVNHYTYGMIGRTPFSLAIALPEPHGSYRLAAQIDVRMSQSTENFTHYFRGRQWRVHPEWEYCSTPQRLSPGAASSHNPDARTPEESALYFLKHNYRWRTSSIRPQVYETVSCDKDLIQSLVLDAKLTDISANEKCHGNIDFSDDQRIRTFGIATTFVATRSGLTRFNDYRRSDEVREAPIYDTNTRAIEETFYRRAVDFYAHSADAFVYSVDFDVGMKYQDGSLRDANFLVTATHALFIGAHKQSIPVAVAGLQMRYNVLHEFFLNTTAKYNVPCAHLDVDCYLIDNNGFVVLSAHRVGDVGRFFGLVDGPVLEHLISTGVYRKIRLYDYQAVCVEAHEPESVTGAASPWHLAHSIFATFWRLLSGLGSLATFYLQVVLGPNSVSGFTVEPAKPEAHRGMGGSSTPGASSGSFIADFEAAMANRTSVRACDKQFDLLEMADFGNFSHSQEIACGDNVACTRKLVAQYVAHTNLLMVFVVNNPSCACTKHTIDIQPVEVPPLSANESCARMRQEPYRKRPEKCYNYHPQEKDIRQCGRASLGVSASFITIVLAFFIVHAALPFYSLPLSLTLSD